LRINWIWRKLRRRWEIKRNFKQLMTRLVARKVHFQLTAATSLVFKQQKFRPTFDPTPSWACAVPFKTCFWKLKTN